VLQMVGAAIKINIKLLYIFNNLFRRFVVFSKLHSIKEFVYKTKICIYLDMAAV